MLNQIQETTQYLKAQGFEDVTVGIILGTGMGNFVKHLEVLKTLDYSDIPHFPVSTVESHSGKLILGRVKDKLIIVMQGRFHYYEGYTLQQITFPVRVMKYLGVQNMIICNAAGGLNDSFVKGDIICLDDHINLLADNPLIGRNIPELGPRFPDMSSPYDAGMIAKFKQACDTNALPFKKGVYAVVSGPSLETRAEYRYIKTIGADMVGMSTVPEVIVCNHMSLPCLGVSVITDLCNPDHLKPVSLEEIIEVANRADALLSQLMINFILLL